MVITIIAEPRSGSTNLANWFFNKKEFSVLYEPITSPKTKWYKHNTSPKIWEYQTPHLLVKEIYRNDTDFLELIEISDRLIILYRENIVEQTESWLNAVATQNWDKNWVFDKNLAKNHNPSYFKELKEGMRKKYLNSNYFTISYEELYYNNGFQKIVDYINLDCIKNKNFPYGQKYRIHSKTKTLI